MNVGDIYKTKGIIKVAPDDLLSSALAQLSSTHDTAFVFDSRNTFLCVISPHLSTLQNMYPPKTKVEHVMIHPPKVTPSQLIEEVAEFMHNAKMHFLPVVEKGVFLGVISARRLLQHCVNMEQFQKPILAIVGTRNRLITIQEDDSIATAIKLFKKHKVSKLVVIGTNLQLKGIISKYDIGSYLHEPQKRQSSETLGGSKKTHLVKNVRNFYVTRVVTVKQTETFSHILKRIVESQKGSVVVVDNEMNVVEIDNIGELIRKIMPKKKAIDFNVQLKHVEGKDEKSIQQMIDHITRRLKHVSDMKQTFLTVTESKGGGVIEIKLRILYYVKQEAIIKKEGKNLADVVRTMKSAIDTLSSRE